MRRSTPPINRWSFTALRAATPPLGGCASSACSTPSPGVNLNSPLADHNTNGPGGSNHTNMNDDDKRRTTKRAAGSSLEIRIGSLGIKMERAAALIALFAGLITAVASIYSGFTKTDAERQSRYAMENRSFAEAQQLLSTQMSETKVLVERLQVEVRNLTTVPEGTQVAAQLQRLDKTVDSVADRLQKLEVVILSDPAKALEMPLLRNELDSTKKGYQSELLALREEVARIYDLTKWFIGLMFTMALGLIGLAVTNFLKAGKKETS
jgi:hypothetical protein